jgi:hypothetical protein
MRELVKPVLIGGAFIAAAVFLSGATGELFADGRNAVLVEEVYTVRPGDTIWGIAEEFCAKNTGTRRYILEYKSGIEELNPWLLEQHGLIYPGDRLKLTYWVKEETE